VSILNPLFEAVAWVMMRIHAVLAVPFGASSGVTWTLTIVILVVLMRLIMVPLFIKQRNSMWKMQSHQPQLQELRRKYKNDKTKLNEETMKFYKENGINPLGGCLPLVAQLPVFWSLFSVLKAVARWTPAAAGHVQTAPQYGMTTQFVESAHNARIFGIALVDQFLHPVAGESLTSRLLIVLFVLISSVTTFLTMRQSQKRNMLNPTATPDPDQPGAAAAQAMSKNMMYIAPFFALTGLYWQFGLVLYWVTTNVWTLGQQHFLFRKLPVVGSATVGASAVQAASGSANAARPAPAKPAQAKSAAPRNGTASSSVKSATRPTGTKPAATAKPAGAKPASTARTNGTARANGTAKSNGAAKSNGTKPASSDGTRATAASAADKATVPSTAAAPTANGNGNGSAASGGLSGSSVLRRFSRSKEEPQDDVPAVPESRVVRQQPVRQARSKRGNSGKR
jgi:YidC/Oxa1 family membrane protein insertase